MTHNVYNTSPELLDYLFDLPDHLIAQEPPKERGDSRLVVLNRKNGNLIFTNFIDLNTWLPKGAILVYNEAKVTPARLLGYKDGQKGQVEVLILYPPLLTSGSGEIDLWCLVKPGKKMKPEAVLHFEGPQGTVLTAKILAIDSCGRRLIRFNFTDVPARILDLIGHLPLPPYIRREDRLDDFNRYQTVYAKKPGAIAAPTAGLHFTREHIEHLEKDGHILVNINLRVGAGTFAPLTEEQLKSGQLHEEFIEVSNEAVNLIEKGKEEGRSLIAVGTTTTRALEWASESGKLEPRHGFGNLFIKPGYQFKTVDGLITNFHLPGSSLIMLVAALAGLENVKTAYAEAVRREFRFYSYGDAMIII